MYRTLGTTWLIKPDGSEKENHGSHVSLVHVVVVCWRDGGYGVLWCEGGMGGGRLGVWLYERLLKCHLAQARGVKWSQHHGHYPHRAWWGVGWRVCKTGVCVCVFHERAHVRARASPVCGKGCHHPHHFALRWQVTGDKRCWPLLPSSLTSFEAQKHRKSHCGLHSSLTNHFGHLPSSLPTCMHSTLLCASVNLVKILPNLKSEIIFAPLAVL